MIPGFPPRPGMPPPRGGPGYPGQYPPGNGYSTFPPGQFPGMPPNGQNFMGMPPGHMGMPPMGFPPGMPFQGMPPVPGMYGAMPPNGSFPMHQQSYAAPPTASASNTSVGQVISAAPTVQSSATTAASSISLFNSHYSSGNSGLVNETSNLLNKTLFANPLAGLSLVLYVGNIPEDLEDAKLLRLLECCGKVNKWIRPTDPITQTMKSFGFVVYAQAVCGLRCYNILSKINLKDGSYTNHYSEEESNAIDLINNNSSDSGAGTGLTAPPKVVDPYKLVIKGAKRETEILQSIQQAEEEAITMLPHHLNISGVYNPIRDSILHIIKPNSETNDPQNPSSTGSNDNSNITQTSGNRILNASNYYAFLEDADNPDGEKILLSEIEKFRQRQQQRDQEAEEDRKKRMRSKIEAFKARKDTVSIASVESKDEYDSRDSDKMSNRKRTQDSSSEISVEEQEAKRRRKMQVLQMLADDDAAINNNIIETQQKQPLLRLNATSNVSTKNKAKVTASSFMKLLEEEEDKPQRKMILLDYTEEELKQMQKESEAALKQFTSVGDDEDYDDDGKGGVRRKGVMNASGAIVPGSVQAKVLAQAQAISAALATKMNESKDNSNTKKDNLKSIVNQIPTERNDLFAYNIDWSTVEQHKIVDNTLKAWVVKKIIEYLGEEEESLVAFIVSKLKKRCHPSELLEELSIVLEEEADQFVMKMWRMLIYYSLKPPTL